MAAGAQHPFIPFLKPIGFLLIACTGLIAVLSQNTRNSVLLFRNGLPATASTEVRSWIPGSQSSSLQDALGVQGHTIASLSKAGFWQGAFCSNGEVNLTGPLFQGLPDLEPQSGKTYLVAGREYVVKVVSFGTVDGEWACGGGDFYEIDLSGAAWKQRLRTVDYGNGTYAFQIVINPDFPGDYNLTVRILYEHYRGLRIAPDRNKPSNLRVLLERRLHVLPSITQSDALDVDLEEQAFSLVDTMLKTPAQSLSQLEHKTQKEERKPVVEQTKEKQSHDQRQLHPTLLMQSSQPLSSCQLSSFKDTFWEGRWVLLEKNNTRAHAGWGSGNISGVHSRGWLYFHKCYFHIYGQAEAWSCLEGKSIFLWGDSNFQDTTRNLIRHVLGPSSFRDAIHRNWNRSLTSPLNSSQHIELTLAWNGHVDEVGNNLGLHTLDDPGAVARLQNLFVARKPDFVVMTSGLHDGMYMINHGTSLLDYIHVLDHALDIWEETLALLSKKPRIIWRATVTPALRGDGSEAAMASNPQNMEWFNAIAAEKVRARFPDWLVVDFYDVTFPYHYGLVYSDGGHYGRPPEYRDGEYFVDLMMGHILLNSMCLTH